MIKKIDVVVLVKLGCGVCVRYASTTNGSIQGASWVNQLSGNANGRSRSRRKKILTAWITEVTNWQSKILYREESTQHQIHKSKLAVFNLM